MSESVLERINTLLQEEKWTRLTITNYTINNFKTLNELLEEVFDSPVEDDVRQLCEDHLKSFKNNITAMYLLGNILLNRHSIDDSNLIQLINIFSENQRWGIVKFLSLRILKFGENRHALRTLGDCYNNEGITEELYKIWERLVRVDYEEADVVYKLAVHEEENGNLEEAISYYKKAVHRFINKNSFKQVQEIWQKLLELIPEETEFFYHAENRVSRLFDKKRTLILLEMQYPYFKNEGNWQTSIKILKRILSIESKNPKARKEIIDCYKQLYAKHSHLEEYIKMSNLSQNWRNIHEAIQDFEKHIAFDTGNFIYHRSWGIGRILKIEDESITIQFKNKSVHSMSLKMAVKSLHILGKHHIWVYRITKSKEALHKQVKKNPLWTLKTIIRSFSNAADIKKIKEELVPSILSPSEWTNWGAKARELLKTHEIFGNLPDNPDVYMVRERPISLEEKVHNRFKAAKNFFDRVKVFQEFLEFSNDSEKYIESDIFREIFEYFLAFLKSPGTYNEQTIASYLIVADLVHRFPFLNPGISLNFSEFFDNIESYETIFQRFNNAKLQKAFLKYTRKYIKNWDTIYITLLPNHLEMDIIRELINVQKSELLVNNFLEVYSSYREKREQFIWYIRNCSKEKWFKTAGLRQEEILIAMIHLLAITERDAFNKRDAVLNKKLSKQIFNYLIKDGEVLKFIQSANRDLVNRIYTLLEDLREIYPKVLSDIRRAISTRFADFEFAVDDDAILETITRSGFLALQKSYELRQKALKKLHEVEVPKNTKEIAAAREFGDLRENAEYKAAKERQDHLNNTARKWEGEFQSVSIVTPEEVRSDQIGFGTVVTLQNLDTQDKEIFTIMGPWESNPKKKILSHLSPFAMKLLGQKKDQELKFIINQRSYHYKVLNIEVANFDEIKPISVTI